MAIIRKTSIAITKGRGEVPYGLLYQVIDRIVSAMRDNTIIIKANSFMLQIYKYFFENQNKKSKICQK